MTNVERKGRPWLVYFGGILAGNGTGILLGGYLAERGILGKGFDPLILIGCFVLITIGSLLRRHGLRSNRIRE